MDEFKQYRRTQIAEMRPVTQHEADNQDTILDNEISVSQTDLENGSPKIGDMIARNPKNHKDQWLVAQQYFNDNFEPMSSETEKTIMYTEDEVREIFIERNKRFSTPTTTRFGEILLKQDLEWFEKNKKK